MIKKFTSIDEVNNITSDNIFKPQIALIGIGGAGSNAVNNMINMGLTGVKFVVVNTDSKSLDNSISPYKLQIGPKVTRGLGAGSKPEIGSQAAEESIDAIKEILRGVNLLFITAGMGGGTGTGASQVIAKLAKDMDILTISFVTRPFLFEGNQRMDVAELGIAELEKFSDSLVVVSNQSLFSVVNDKTSLSDAFRVTDNVLYSGIKAITDLLVASGLVNLDFNDIKYAIEGKGRAMIGSGEASGENRALTVVEQAIYNPLLEDVSIAGAKSVLINITGSLDMTLHEVDIIINTIKKELDKDAFINFGAIHDSALVDTLRVSIVATALQDKAKISLLRRNSVDSDVATRAKDYLKRHESGLRKGNVSAQEREGLVEIKSFVSGDNYDNKEQSKARSNNVFTKEDFNIKEMQEKEVHNNGRSSDDETNQDSDVFNQVKVLDDSMLFKSYTEKESEVGFKMEYEEEKNEEDFEVKKPKRGNLFDLIVRGKASREEDDHDRLKEDEILNIKNRNKISKESGNVKEEREDSFFDLPAFLRNK